MAAEGKSVGGNGAKSKKRKQRYLPYNKPVKKGSFPLRPGVIGFFITCEGGRELQAIREAINLLDTFCEELVEDVSCKRNAPPAEPLNKITKFTDSDSSSSDDELSVSEKHDDDHEKLGHEAVKTIHHDESWETNVVDESNGKNNEGTVQGSIEDCKSNDLPLKKQRVDSVHQSPQSTVAEKYIDERIKAELDELGNIEKRRFVSLDTGCNGCIFIQMHKHAEGPGPGEVAQHMMTTAASRRKHMSRFISRVLPIEAVCYASTDEITKVAGPLIDRHFPAKVEAAKKYAVLFESRANTGIDRMEIINAVAKCVPAPHKVDLSHPDKTIIVQVAKTICLIGIVDKYKELSKFNLRQLTSVKH